MNIRYFFVTDRVKAKEIRIQHRGTEAMLGDYFTKPLQGQLFRRMRNIIMNIDPSSKYYLDHRSVLSYVPVDHEAVTGSERMDGKDTDGKDDDEDLTHDLDLLECNRVEI
jgi:hypothetical protein